MFGLITGRPPKIDLLFEKNLQILLRKIIGEGLINSAHDLSEGGLAIALAESSISSKLGINSILPNTSSRIDRILFGEGGSRVLISISPINLDKFQKVFNQFNLDNQVSLSCTRIGEVIETNHFSISLNDYQLIELSISELIRYFENAIPRRIATNNKVKT